MNYKDKFDMVRSLIGDGNEQAQTTDEVSEADKETERQLIEARYNMFIKSIPDRYKEADLEKDFNVDGDLIKSLDRGDNVLFLGTNGIGKTHLAWAYAKKVVKSGRTCKFVKVSRMLADIKSKIAWGDIYEYMEDKYGKGLGVLIIDEIDKKKITDADYEYLSYILDYRYEWMMQTVLIGNCTEAQFKENMGTAIYSRLAGDGGKVYEVRAKDRRLVG